MRLRRTSLPTPKACAKILGISRAHPFGPGGAFPRGRLELLADHLRSAERFFARAYVDVDFACCAILVPQETPFRDYTTHGKGNGIYEIAERRTIEPGWRLGNGNG